MTISSCVNCFEDPAKQLQSSTNSESPTQLETDLIDALMLAARKGALEHTKNDVLRLPGVRGADNAKRAALDQLVGRNLVRVRIVGRANVRRYSLRAITEAIRGAWGDDPDNGNG